MVSQLDIMEALTNLLSKKERIRMQDTHKQKNGDSVSFKLVMARNVMLEQKRKNVWKKRG